MGEIKLRLYDGISVSGFLMLPGLFYTAPGFFLEENGCAAWIAVIAAYILTLLVFLCTMVLMRQHEGKDIIGAVSTVMGKPSGILYGFLLSLYFCFTTGAFIRECAEIFKTYGLRMTPVYVIAGLILLAAVLMNSFGAMAIVKSAGVFFILILLGISFIMLLGLNRYNPDYLFPILGNGLRDIAKSAWHISSMPDGVIMLALFAPAFKNTGEMRKSGVISLAASGVLSVLFYLCFTMMFSAPIASKMISGFVEMGKSIYYNHFFYRFESILLFFLIFSSIITASLGFFIARTSAAANFRVGVPNLLSVIYVVLIFTVACIPANLLDLSNHYLSAIRRYSVFLMSGFPLLLLIISSFKRIFKNEKI